MKENEEKTTKQNKEKLKNNSNDQENVGAPQENGEALKENGEVLRENGEALRKNGGALKRTGSAGKEEALRENGGALKRTGSAGKEEALRENGGALKRTGSAGKEEALRENGEALKGTGSARKEEALQENPEAPGKRKRRRDNDLGKDPLGSLLLRLALPSITAQLVNMLYNIVDRIYIGHIAGVGASALTGVGVCFPVILLITAFSSLVGMGGAPRAAIKMGQGEDKSAEKVLGNCLTVLLCFSAILTVFFLFAGRSLLLVFGASSETLPYGLEYLNIYVCGTVFVQLGLGMNPFISTQGFAKFSMLTVLIGAAINIVLDPVFIFGFSMGVRGAALATVLAQMVSAVWVLKFLMGRRTRLRIRKENMHLKRNIILPVLALGVSPFIMQSTECLVNIALNSSLQRYGGDMAVGAMTILTSVMQIFNMPVQGMTQGGTPIISFNYGAGSVYRVKRAYFLMLRAILIFACSFWVSVMLFARFYVSIFTSDPKLLSTAAWALRIYMAGTFILGLQTGCQQTFLALGQARVSMLLSLLRKVILLIPLVYILPHLFTDQVFAVFLAEPIADVTAAITTGSVFLVQFRKILSRMERKTSLPREEAERRKGD